MPEHGRIGQCGNESIVVDKHANVFERKQLVNYCINCQLNWLLGFVPFLLSSYDVLTHCFQIKAIHFKRSIEKQNHF